MSKKIKEVKKFGGVDQLGEVKVNGHNHDAANVEAQSTRKLEDDKGEGAATVIRCFTFKMNAEAIVEQKPTKQDLFNAHLKGIELALWKDGLKTFSEVPPRMTFDTDKLQYSIFVAARPMKGFLLQERPQTLTEIAHGN